MACLQFSKTTSRVWSLLIVLLSASPLTDRAQANDDKLQIIPPKPADQEAKELPESGPTLEAPPATSESKNEISPGRIDLKIKPVGELTINVVEESGDIPENLAPAGLAAAAGLVADRATTTNLIIYEWAPSCLKYGNLYFEDVNAERYGHDFGAAQPLLSAVHFASRLPATAYLAGQQPPGDLRYVLGFRQPGSKAPFVFELPHCSEAGGQLQAAATLGLIFLIP